MDLGSEFQRSRAFVLLFEDERGDPFAVGPIYTDPGIREARALIEARGYRNNGTVPLMTRVRFCTS